MVTKNITVVESDLSGEPGAEPTLIGLRGEVLELDLTSDERRRMDEVFAPYIAKARRLGPMTGRSVAPRRVPESTPEQRAEIRAWAEAEGYEIARRGQIPNKVVSAFRAAHTAA
jgi:hypothetical protein